MRKTISLRMDENLIKHLKKMSHVVSIERNQDISYNDLIIEALTVAFPLPEENQHKHANKTQVNKSQRI